MIFSRNPSSFSAVLSLDFSRSVVDGPLSGSSRGAVSILISCGTFSMTPVLISFFLLSFASAKDLTSALIVNG